MRLQLCLFFLLAVSSVFAAEKSRVKLIRLQDRSTTEISVYHFENFSAEKLEGYVIRPTGKGSWPAVVINHGATNHPLDKAMQIAPTLARRGYVIIAPRYTFAKLKNDKYERRDPLIDAKRCLAAARLANSIDFIKQDQLAVAGISAGGFVIVNCLLVKHPYKSAVVTSAGIAPYNKESVDRLKQSKIPVLIQLGTKDEVIPLDYGQRLYKTLKQAKIKTELKLYPNATHDLYKNHPKKIAGEMADWFDKTLKE